MVYQRIAELEIERSRTTDKRRAYDFGYTLKSKQLRKLL